MPLVLDEHCWVESDSSDSESERLAIIELIDSTLDIEDDTSSISSWYYQQDEDYHWSPSPVEIHASCCNTLFSVYPNTIAEEPFNRTERTDICPICGLLITSADLRQSVTASLEDCLEGDFQDSLALCLDASRFGPQNTSSEPEPEPEPPLSVRLISP